MQKKMNKMFSKIRMTTEDSSYSSPVRFALLSSSDKRDLTEDIESSLFWDVLGCWVGERARTRSRESGSFWSRELRHRGSADGWVVVMAGRLGGVDAGTDDGTDDGTAYRDKRGPDVKGTFRGGASGRGGGAYVVTVKWDLKCSTAFRRMTAHFSTLSLSHILSFSSIPADSNGVLPYDLSLLPLILSRQVVIVFATESVDK